MFTCLVALGTRRSRTGCGKEGAACSSRRADSRRNRDHLRRFSALVSRLCRQAPQIPKRPLRQLTMTIWARACSVRWSVQLRQRARILPPGAPRREPTSARPVGRRLGGASGNTAASDGLASHRARRVPRRITPPLLRHPWAASDRRASGLGLLLAVRAKTVATTTRWMRSHPRCGRSLGALLTGVFARQRSYRDVATPSAPRLTTEAWPVGAKCSSPFLRLRRRRTDPPFLIKKSWVSAPRKRERNVDVAVHGERGTRGDKGETAIPTCNIQFPISNREAPSARD